MHGVNFLKLITVYKCSNFWSPSFLFWVLVIVKIMEFVHIKSQLTVNFFQIIIILLSSRLYQAAKLFMFCPSSGLYSCPLAMTDGAAKTVEV